MNEEPNGDSTLQECLPSNNENNLDQLIIQDSKSEKCEPTEVALIDSKTVDDDQNCSPVLAQYLNTADITIQSNEMSEETMTNDDSIENDSKILDEKMNPDQEAELTSALGQEIQSMKAVHDQAIELMKEKVEDQSRAIEEILVSFFLD